jgi:hypothetical protein
MAYERERLSCYPSGAFRHQGMCIDEYPGKTAMVHGVPVSPEVRDYFLVRFSLLIKISAIFHPISFFPHPFPDFTNHYSQKGFFPLPG